MELFNHEEITITEWETVKRSPEAVQVILKYLRNQSKSNYRLLKYAEPEKCKSLQGFLQAID